MSAMPRARERSRSENDGLAVGASTMSAPNPSGSHRMGAIRASVTSSTIQYSVGTCRAISAAITNGSSRVARNALPSSAGTGRVAAARIGSAPWWSTRTKSPESGSRR